MTPYKVLPHQEEEIWGWYQQVEAELQDNLAGLSPRELEHLREYYVEAGLLTQWRQPFFRHHYSYPFAYVMQTAGNDLRGKTILDLGGGSGTQAIHFARKGAEVHVVDLDDIALGALEKRRRHYEAVFSQPLNIHTHCVNIFDYLQQDVPSFDLVYSLFAFNMVQPTRELLPLLSKALKPDGQLIVQDGNREHLVFRHLRKRPALSMAELGSALRENGFDRTKFFNCIALPPMAWKGLPQGLSVPLDRALLKLPHTSISYLLLAEKTPS